MKYSQPARAASSRRDFSLSGATIKFFRFIRPKIRHSFKNAVGSRAQEDGLAVTRLIVAASDKSPDCHAGRLGCRYTADAILDHKGIARMGLHPLGRVKEEIGCGLAAFHHLGAIERAAEWSVPAPGSDRGPPSRFVRGTDQAPDPDRG